MPPPTKGEEFLIAMLDQDAGARVLGEIAIGTNYSIQRLHKNTLFDEKIGGTFHAAVGAAYPRAAARNESGLHWDMVCDLRQGGRMFVDGQADQRERPVSGQQLAAGVIKQSAEKPSAISFSADCFSAA